MGCAFQGGTALDDSIIAEGDDWGKNDANLWWTKPSAKPASRWQISADRGLEGARNKVLDDYALLGRGVARAKKMLLPR
jgi:hypothetical protein